MNSHRGLASWIVITLALLVFGCNSSGSDSATKHLERAKDYLDNQDYKAAIIELKNSLLSEENNPEARYLLGKAYLETNNPVSAEKELSVAQSLGLTDAAIQPYLTKALFVQNKYEQVLEQSTPKGMPDDSYSEWLSIRGESLIALDRMQEAEAQFSEALERWNDSAAARTGLARIAAIDGNYKEARNRISTAHSIDSKYAPAWALLGDIEAHEGNLPAAEKAYSLAIESQPNNWSYLISRCLVLIVQKKYNEASADINTLKELTKNNPQVNYVKGLLYFQKKQYSDAKEQFEASLRKNSDDQPTMFYLATTDLMLGNYAQAENGYSRFLSHDPDNMAATRLQAVTKLRLGDPGETERLARSVIKDNPQDTLALRLLASALVNQGKDKQSVEYLRKVVVSNPDSASAHRQLGAGLIAQGEKQEGVEQLEKALELDPHSHPTAAALITAHIQNGNLDLALETAQAFVEDNHDQASPHVLLGIVYLQRNELHDAENAFQKALEIEPGSPAAYNGLASIAVKSNNYEKAKQYYLDALKKNPEHLKIQMNLAEVEARLHNLEEMRSVLEQAIKYHPNALEPRITLARSYLQSGDGDKAIELLTETGPKNADNPAVLAMLAEAQLTAGQPSQAISTLHRLDTVTPNSAKVHFLFAKTYNELNEKEKMRAELIRSLELNPNFGLARIALARVLLQDREARQAEEQIRLLRGQLTPTNPDLLQLEAQLQVLNGDAQGAILSYQKIFLQTPTSANLLNLARVRWEAGDKNDAINDVEDWLEEHPDDSAAKSVLDKMRLEPQHN